MKHQCHVPIIRLWYISYENVSIYVFYMCIDMRECILFHVITNDELDMIEISIY